MAVYLYAYLLYVSRLLLNDRFGDGWDHARLMVYSSSGWHRAYGLSCGDSSRVESYCFTPDENTDGDFVVLSIVGFRATHFWDVSVYLLLM